MSPQGQSGNGTAPNSATLPAELAELRRKVSLLATELRAGQVALESKVSSNAKLGAEHQATNELLSEAVRTLQESSYEQADPDMDPGTAWPVNLSKAAQNKLRDRARFVDRMMNARAPAWRAALWIAGAMIVAYMGAFAQHQLSLIK